PGATRTSGRRGRRKSPRPSLASLLAETGGPVAEVLLGVLAAREGGEVVGGVVEGGGVDGVAIGVGQVVAHHSPPCSRRRAARARRRRSRCRASFRSRSSSEIPANRLRGV